MGHVKARALQLSAVELALEVVISQSSLQSRLNRARLIVRVATLGEKDIVVKRQDLCLWCCRVGRTSQAC